MMLKLGYCCSQPKPPPPVMSIPFEQDKEVYAAKGRHALLSGHSVSMPECDHEEADKRVCIHIIDALLKGENCSKNSGYRHCCDSSWGFWTAS